MQSTIGYWYPQWLKKLKTVEQPAFELDRLFLHRTGWHSATLRAYPEKQLSPEQITELESLVNRRAQGEPLAYLMGTQGFWDMVLAVNESTLIPRPETELLVETLLAQFGPETHKAVLDMGTGSGAIACALAKARPHWQVWAVDISEAALAVARQNVALLHLNSQVQCIAGSWFEPLVGLEFDIIVSNPPYIAESEPEPYQGDCRFEPPGALMSGPTGLEALQHLIDESPHFIKKKGWLLLEHGYRQQERVLALMQARGWQLTKGTLDLNGLPRLCVGQWCE